MLKLPFAVHLILMGTVDSTQKALILLKSYIIHLILSFFDLPLLLANGCFNAARYFPVFSLLLFHLLSPLTLSCFSDMSPMYRMYQKLVICLNMRCGVLYYKQQPSHILHNIITAAEAFKGLKLGKKAKVKGFSHAVMKKHGRESY